ncbi:RNA polymerase sigma factor [Aquabacterium sp. J223]|uniref:RNA polymerase sigma factor n=1 Tax=Aquabacterium sp. J223 TaxID=2898431 RepID=UPI0021AE2ECB|nr:sigma-70 family RNA polymerase sigma factor [Aquabacterium sp. J223]UUX96260.1 sigma-70 family RNA polymerase sigma factor [Aquabacterium sp. J223]
MLAAIPRLRRYARTLVYDPAAADDLAQATLERALARWRQFDAGRDLVVWLLCIAHNLHVDEHRRQSRWRPLEADEADALAHEPAPPVDVGLRLDLVAALRRLPDDQREALLLVVVEQMSYAEAAQVLGVAAGTVMSRVSRARAQLRRLLEAPAGRVSPPLRRVV